MTIKEDMIHRLSLIMPVPNAKSIVEMAINKEKEELNTENPPTPIPWGGDGYPEIMYNIVFNTMVARAANEWIEITTKNIEP